MQSILRELECFVSWRGTRVVYTADSSTLWLRPAEDVLPLLPLRGSGCPLLLLATLPFLMLHLMLTA
jgi:hypothetical protein